MKDYFTFEEMIVTNQDLPNNPPLELLSNGLRLNTILNVIRHELGLPIKVNSCYRSEPVNSAVGGVCNSKHLQWLAADITCNNMVKLKSICMRYRNQNTLSELVIHNNYIHIAI